jgi:hypothetical protein
MYMYVYSLEMYTFIEREEREFSDDGYHEDGLRSSYGMCMYIHICL